MKRPIALAILCFSMLCAPGSMAVDPVRLLDPDRYGAGTIIGALERLSTYGPPQAVEPAMALLAHPVKDVATTAAWLLRRMGRGEQAAGAAAQYLSSSELDEQQKVSAAAALGITRARAAIAPLVQALGSASSWRIRRQAAISLGLLHRAGQAEVLLQCSMADEEEMVRTACTRALSRVPDSTAQQLITLLESGEPYGVRREAAWALGRRRFVHGQGVSGALTRALQSDPDCRVAAAAAWALGASGDPTVLPALEAARQSPCRLVRQAAELAAKLD